MKKNIKIMLAVIIFMTLMIGIAAPLKFKYGDGILGIQTLYKQKEGTIDVLALGSSHAFEDINTGMLWEDYGISAYVLAGSVQPYWNSYYYLQEALKTQRPKLVILEGYGSVFSSEYSDHSRIIKNNLGIKDLDLKKESLEVSAPEETRDNYLFDYRLWHSRYEELNESDFAQYYQKPIYQYYKGFGVNFVEEAFEKPQINITKDNMRPMTEKAEKYFRKIVELCQKEKIPIMVVVSPYVLTETEQMVYYYTEKIANEYGIPLINFNNEEYYQKMSLNFETDFSDPSHLNYRGNEKFTKILAEEIKSRFELEDHRGDVTYESWEQHVKDVNHRVFNYELTQITTPNEFINSIPIDQDYVVFIISATGSVNKRLQDMMSMYSPLKSVDKLQDHALYIIERGELQTSINDLVWEYEKELDNNYLNTSLKFVQDDSQNSFVQSIKWNGVEKIDSQEGYYILVYDIFEKEQVCLRQLRVNANEEIELIII